jgi:UDP-N-acetylmuramyl tripeptide synthase
MSAVSISSARLSAATYAGRLAGTASRLARRGTGASIRGKVMLKIDPSALQKLLAGKRIALVSGTNGKTTTTHFLAAALRESLGPDVDRLVHNAEGANLHHGIASALSEHAKADIAILESDERVVGDLIKLGRPEVLVLLNFSRDQLDRHHEIKSLSRRAVGRLGRIGRRAGRMGGHGDDLDPRFIAVPRMRLRPHPDSARPSLGAGRRLVLLRLWPSPTQGRLPRRERYDR